MAFRSLCCVLLLFAASCASYEQAWTKHTIYENQGKLITTAVAADYTGDGLPDVITSDAGRVLLFVAPDWQQTVLHEMPDQKRHCIHSETLDVDGDGDQDWVGSLPWGKPFWLENPGEKHAPWAARVIDHDIKGIHCFLKADIDRDGKLDVIVNNFSPEGVLGDSVVWMSVPADVKDAPHWDRHVFADRDAPGGSHYFGFGDLDGDGWGEITVAAKGDPFENGNWFAYWKNPGKNQVKQPWKRVTVAQNQLGATNILPGDLNGDGKPDLLASNGHGRGVFWFESPGWAKRMIDTEMDCPHCLVLADLDGDGDLDAASCGFQSKRVSIYRNDGKGRFTRHDLDQDQESYDLRAVDMDRDGDPDLLNAGRRGGNVVWYENPGAN